MEQLTRVDPDVSVISVPVAPGLALEVVYDDEGIAAATWQGSGWWRIAEIGEAGALAHLPRVGYRHGSGAEVDMHNWNDINKAFERVDSLFKDYRRGLCDGSAKPSEQTALVKEELKSALFEAQRALAEHWSAVISVQAEDRPQDHADEPQIAHHQLDGLAEANKRLVEQARLTSRVKL